MQVFFVRNFLSPAFYTKFKLILQNLNNSFKQD